MCTLIVAKRVFPAYPIVIAANRDEDLDRPSSPPQVWKGDPAILAPVDERAGGTWIGISDRGIVAAITNRHAVPTVPGRESRGTLVLAALQAPRARTAVNVIASLRGSMFNGFHLVVLDGKEGFLLRGNGQAIEAEPLRDGLHVITQFGAGISNSMRAARIDVRYRVYAKGAPPTPVVLNALLSIHDEDAPIDGSCVHMPGYGTRSSTLIRVADGGGGADYWHREGPACGSRFGAPVRFAFRTRT